MPDTITGNAAVDWTTFDPAAYVRQYTPPREEDLEVARRMRAHFTDADGHGIDVGTGANLYPALAMLAAENVTGIELIDHSKSNTDWLEATLDKPLDEMWRPYAACWHCAKRRMYADTWIGEASLLGDFPTVWYDLGTMACVAESITADPAEFEQACERFLGALRPGSPYVATFTRMSSGYRVGDAEFPAVPVDADDVWAVLEPLSAGLQVSHIRIDPPLYPGWTGLIYAEGTVR